MTYEELKEIKLRLDRWREERHLDYKSQHKGFIPNVLDELREYYLATSDDEKVAELCDVVIFCLNVSELSFTFFEEIVRQDNGENVEDVLLHLQRMIVGKKTFSFSDNNTTRVMQHLSLYAIIFICENVAKKLGYNFCECLKEKVKEIESRTGHYDESLGKFIKDKGAYTQEEAQKLISKDYGKGFCIKNAGENEEFFQFEVRPIYQGLGVIDRTKKWHKAKMIKNA